MTRPDFLGIGAQKAGTAWLYQTLRVHPDIWLPPVKELHYFDRKPRSRRQLILGKKPNDLRWRRQLSQRTQKTIGAVLPERVRIMARRLGLRAGEQPWAEAYRAELRRDPRRIAADARWDLRYFFERRNDTWYHRLFEPAGDRVAGDITPGYAALSEEQVRGVRAMLPSARIIFIMRDPIARTWSGLRMYARHRAIDVGSEAFLMEYARRSSVMLRSDYVRTLSIWEAHYPAEQIFLGFLEELAEPEDLLLRLYRFLGVDASPRHIPGFARSKVHAGRPQEMPRAFARQLAREHHAQLQALHARFGGYATRWLESAEAILDGAEARA